MSVNVTIDDLLCQGHGRCEALAPHLFEFDDLGYARVIRSTPAGHDVEFAASAAANCPEQAIRVTRKDPSDSESLR
ncbi:hypothetical protein GCM10023350_09080 [Nocardioides endophyticus]|uniref:Ferredoxin n=1 Tax=Nocardioides endophyticus TaxID=1353775 RepID=A0ABP8YJZ5_9ACTN